MPAFAGMTTEFNCIVTKMRAQARPGKDPSTLPAPDQITNVFVELAEASCMKTGEIVEVVVRKAD